MSGTHKGGVKTAATMKQRFGQDIHQRIGRAGGKLSRSGGFASNVIGDDGLTGRERASIAGAKGGAISKRNKEKLYSDYVVPENPGLVMRIKNRFGLN